MPGKIKYKFFIESENIKTYCSDYVLDTSNYAFIFLANGNNGLEVYSVSDLGILTHIDNNDQGGSARDVWVDKDFVYLANDTRGIEVYSVSGAGILTHLNNDDQGGNAIDVRGDGKFIYLANQNNGLEVYSVDNNGLLTHIDNNDQGGAAYAVWGDGKFIYLANNVNGIEVYSVSNAGILTHLDNDDQGGSAQGVWGDGKFIYLANFDRGIEVYSVSGVGILTHIDNNDQGGAAYAVWGDGKFIYLANGNRGIEVYSVSGAGILTHLNNDDQGGNAIDVRGDGKFIYLANGARGIEVYSVSNVGILTHLDNDFIAGSGVGVFANKIIYEVFPQYDDEFGIKWEREQDQIFFRKQIDGELTFACFNGIRDYNCLHYLPIDEEVTLRIFSSCDDYVKPIYIGYFTKRNMFWDEDERVATVRNIIPYDGYACILRNWETEYNIVGLPDYIVSRVPGTWPEIFQHCKRIAEIIQYLLDEMECNIIYQSMFFDNDLTGDTDNYVTGDDPNELNNLMISDKSNILGEVAGGGGGGSGVTFDPATVSNLSLKQLLDTLRHLYDIRWHIDAAGFFRIEHTSFYINVLGALSLHDLTILTNEYADKEYAYRTNKYDYLDLPDREEFVYSEKNQNHPLGIGTILFEDYFFDYTYSNRFPGGTKNTKEIINHIISGFTNDLRWLCSVDPDDIKANPDGFTILQVTPDGADYKCTANNQDLCWILLLDNYWQNYRPFIYAIRGYFDKDSPPGWSVETFDSKKRSKKQIPIEIHGCCDPFDDDFDIFDLIKTHLGNGEIYNFKYVLSSGAVIVELLYEAEDIEMPVLP